MVKIIRIRRKGTRRTSIIVMFTFPGKYSSRIYRREKTRNMIMQLARIRENRQVHERTRERERGGEDRELRIFNYVRKELPSKKPFFIKITLDRVLVFPKQNVRFPVMFLTRERKRARRNTKSERVNEAGGKRRGKEEKRRHSSLEWRKVAENVRVKETEGK